MAHVEKRNGRWRARYRGPDGRERSKTFDRKTDAERFLAGVEVDKARGEWTDPALGRQTFAYWAERWLAESMHLKPKTVAGYESILEAHVLPAFARTPIGRVDRSAVSRFVAEMTAAGKGAGTVRNAYNVVRSVCRIAAEGSALASNPCDGVRLPRPERDEMRFLDASEVEILAAEMPDGFGTLVTFAAYTGLRAGELAGLRVGRVDLLRGRVEVAESFAEVHGRLELGPTKTYASRSVALPPFLRDELAEHMAERADDRTAFVFPAAEGGPLRHSNFYRRVFKPAVVRAGLAPPPLRFHDLRHTCAALLIAQGAHPRALMERLGHSSVTVSLDRYGHLLPSLDEALTDGLDDTYREALRVLTASWPRPGGREDHRLNRRDRCRDSDL